MRKLVLLHKRDLAEDVERFHARLAALPDDDPVVPGLARYVQSHALVRGYAKGELLFDALEELSFATPQAAAEAERSDAWRALTERRRAVVDGSASHAMTVDVHRVKDLPVPADAVKSIEFVNRRPGMELGAFRRYWREVHGPLGSTIPSILRYEQNHLAPEAYADGAEPRFDGLAVTWFASTAAMREGTTSEAYAATREDEANFLPDGHLPFVITREVLERA